MSLLALANAGRCFRSTRATFLCRHLLSSSHADPVALTGCQAATFGQIRHARTRGKAGAQMERGGDRVQGQPGLALPEGEEPEELGPPEVPEEILDGWDKDEDIQAFLSIFASEELQGKKLLSHRDVAKLFESMGLSREQLSSMIKGEGGEDEDDEEDMSMLAQKGGGKGGDLYSYGGGKGGQGGYESDFDNFGGRGGKGGGKDGKGGGKGGGYQPDFGDFSGGGKGKGGGYKGGKGKGRSSDFDDDFGGFGRGGKGGKGGGKGGKGKF